MAGMNLGASHIGAHVVVFSKTQAGVSPVDSFDIQVKGGDPLPLLVPSGLPFMRQESLVKLFQQMARS